MTVKVIDAKIAEWIARGARLVLEGADAKGGVWIEIMRFDASADRITYSPSRRFRFYRFREL